MAPKPRLRASLRLATPLQSCCHQQRCFSRKVDEAAFDVSQKNRSRMERINSRLPKFLQRYTRPIVTAPLTHVSAFLVLHEVTAVVPLLGLAAAFHYSQWLPPYISEGKWVRDGVQKFGNYFRRKGWLGEEGQARRYKSWAFGEGGVKIVVEFATAYAITKALLPLRLALSVWATPWFARVAVHPATNAFRQMFKRTMASNYLATREKKNAEEWQVKGDGGAYEGNLHNYYNEGADFESESASEEWTTVQPYRAPKGTRDKQPQSDLSQFGGKKQQPPSAGSKPHPKHSKIVSFRHKRDNAAKAAYRMRKPADGFHRINKNLRELIPSQASINGTLESIGIRCGSFICPPRHLLNPNLAIWGNPKQVLDTKKALQEWETTLSEPSSVSKKGFASLYSVAGVHYAADEKQAKAEALKHRYQQVPEENQQFSFSGFFLWPNTGAQATDLFGPSCEAFDPVRVSCEAYMVFDHRRSVFQIHSNKGAQNVQNVIARIEMAMKEYLARDQKPVSMLLVEPPTEADWCADVETVPGPLLGSPPISTKLAVLGQSLIPTEVLGWKEESRKTHDEYRLRMQEEVYNCILRLRYYRGHISIRVQLGTFALVKFLWPEAVKSVPWKTFAKNIQLPGTKGVMTRDLQLNLAPQEIIDKFKNASNVVLPWGTGDPTNQPIPAKYVVVFYMRHPKNSSEVVLLEMESNEVDGTEETLESVKAVWKKAGKGDVWRQPSPLEISMLRLSSPLDPSRITPSMQEFVRKVKFRKAPEGTRPEVTGYKVFTYTPVIPIIGFEQKMALKFRVNAYNNYALELSRYDEYHGPNPNFPSSTKWAAVLYNPEWDLHLAQNAKCEIGQAAAWSETVQPSAFFPPSYTTSSQDPNAGFEDFLGNMSKVTGFLDELKSYSKRSPSTPKSHIQELLDDSARPSDLEAGAHKVDESSEEVHDTVNVPKE
ncbi:MAG: hypothetical protein Q9214_002335 [Letrouitia sp. 1 TL-2023]